MQTGDPTGDSLFWPIVPSVNPVAAIGAMPSLVTCYQKIDPYYWGPLETSVNTWFDQEHQVEALCTRNLDVPRFIRCRFFDRRASGYAPTDQAGLTFCADPRSRCSGC